MPARTRDSGEERVTPLELFFDLIFVFAITQVTGLVVADPTWAGLVRGLLVLSVLWWAWAAYAWLTNTIDPEEGVVRLAMFGAMGAMLIASFAVPGRLRRRCVSLRLCLRDRPDCAPRPLRRCRTRRSGAARGGCEAWASAARSGWASSSSRRRSTASRRSPSGRSRSPPTSSARTSAVPAAGISRRATSSSGTD